MRKKKLEEERQERQSSWRRKEDRRIRQGSERSKEERWRRMRKRRGFGWKAKKEKGGCRKPGIPGRGPKEKRKKKGWEAENERRKLAMQEDMADNTLPLLQASVNREKWIIGMEEEKSEDDSKTPGLVLKGAQV